MADTPPKLRPVSDLARRFLEKLGETPSEHQRQIMAKTKLSVTVTTKANDTKDPVWKINKAVLAKLDAQTPLQDLPVVKQQYLMESLTWVPEAYVLFVNRIFCTTCKTWSDSVARPGIFLQHRAASRDPSQPKHYIPVKETSLKLPHILDLSLSTSTGCLTCWAKKPAGETTPTSPLSSPTAGHPLTRSEDSTVEPTVGTTNLPVIAGARQEGIV